MSHFWVVWQVLASSCKQTHCTLSGWISTANFLYCFLMSSSVASRGTPRTLHTKKWISKNYWKIIILYKSPMISLQRILNMPVWCMMQYHATHACKACDRKWCQLSLSDIWAKFHITWQCDVSLAHMQATSVCLGLQNCVKINIYQILFGLMRC